MSCFVNLFQESLPCCKRWPFWSICNRSFQRVSLNSFSSSLSLRLLDLSSSLLLDWPGLELWLPGVEGKFRRINNQNSKTINYIISLKVLFVVGHGICKDSYSDYCFCIRTSTYNLVLVLLWSPHFGLCFPSRTLVLHQENQWRKGFHHSLCSQCCLLRWGHG